MAEDFLRRWSRRKLEGGRQAEAPEHKPAAPEMQAPDREPHPRTQSFAPAQPDPGAALSPAAGSPALAGKTDAPTELPSLDSLEGLGSDYRDFLQPEVDEDLRRQALKKLFQDPHFNVMDGLDVYIDDYTKSDPIPAAMLKDLLHARRTLLPGETDDEAGKSAPLAANAEGMTVELEPEPQPELEREAAPHPAATPDAGDDACQDGKRADASSPATSAIGPADTNHDPR
jgi:hypothetical protein